MCMIYILQKPDLWTNPTNISSCHCEKKATVKPRREREERGMKSKLTKTFLELGGKHFVKNKADLNKQL